MTMSDYPAATHHDPIEELLPDLFWVHGTVELRPGMFLSRNMAIVRRGGDLSLVNSVRLTEEGERALAALGEVKNVVRIGNFHGMDDRYYVDTHAARFWCLPGRQAREEPSPDGLLSADNLPFDGSALHVFEGANFPECALVLEEDGGVLLTADSLQYWSDWSNCSDGMEVGAAQMGFSLRMLVGPPWLAGATPAGGSLERDFQRLLGFDFDHMLGAHGGFHRGGAKRAVEAAVEKAFAEHVP
jgi:hypothetical protein